MLQISVSKAKAKLSEYLNRAAYGRERIVIQSRGKPKAAIIGIEDLERFEELEDAMAAAGALEAFQAGETVPWEQIKAEILGESRGVQD